LAGARSTSAGRLSSNSSVGDGDRRRERSDSDILVSEYHKVCRLARRVPTWQYFVLSFNLRGIYLRGMAPHRLVHAWREHVACVSCWLSHVRRQSRLFPEATHVSVCQVPLHVRAQAEAWELPRAEVRFVACTHRATHFRRRRSCSALPCLLSCKVT
jgi:hypothetical protein